MLEQAPPACPRPNFAALVAECRQLYLDRLGAIVREAGVTSAAAIAALQGGAAEFYDEITLRRARAGFERCAFALESFLAQRDHDIQAAAEAYVPRAEGQERRDLAALAAGQAVHAGDDPAVAPLVAEFLRSDWRRVLEAVHLEHGGAGQSWTDNVSVIDELLWSLTPKHDAEERRRLAATVPAPLRRINAGLARIAVAPAARTPFFDACFALQTAAPRAKAGATSKAARRLKQRSRPASRRPKRSS